MDVIRRLVILVVASAAFATLFEPSQTVRDELLAAFGKPAYEGIWILIPHIFLYSTLAALACAAAWRVAPYCSTLPSHQKLVFSSL